jgi:SAM-dependent methyltransferase
MITTHHKCRLCDSGNIEEVIDLGYSPLANAYLSEAQLRDVLSGKREEIFTPLRCFLCMDCGSVQLSHSVPGDVLFGDYIYASSTSPSFVRHFEELAAHCVELGLVKANDLVVDVGSNDGIGLAAFQKQGCRVAGVEPSEKLADLALNRELLTFSGFLSSELANQIVAALGKAKLVTATNVFAHLSDLKGFVQSVKEMLDADGVFIFENSYLGDVVDKMLFDTIYMEHQFYHSIRPLYKFMRRMGLPIFRVERIPTHGGSIRVFCGNRAEEPSVSEMLRSECALGNPHTYRDFGDRIQCYKHRLHSVLKPLGPIAAYGCPAKFTTFTHALELTDRFEYVVDDSPLKVGMFTPGSHLPIYERYKLDGTVSAFVSAWNFFDQIYAENKARCRSWIRPLPNLEILP